MGVERGVGFFFHGGRQAVAADHHDRVEVVGLSAKFLALGGSQLNCSHPGIIV